MSGALKYNKLHKLLRIYDISCNIPVTLYINYITNWQPYTNLLSLFGGYIWILNNKIYNRNVWIHIFGVQLPPLICLIYFK